MAANVIVGVNTMSDSDDDSRPLGIFPDFSKEYRRWLHADISKFMLPKETNADTSTEGKEEAATRRSKRRKHCSSGLNDELDDDVILVEDSLLESAPIASNQTRGRGRGRRSESIILVEDSLLESAPIANSQRRGRGRGRRGESAILNEDSQRETAPVGSRGRGRRRGMRGNTRSNTTGLPISEAAPAVTNEVPLLVKDSDEGSTDGELFNTSVGSDDVSNYEMSVKVKWKSKDIHRFKIRKFQMMKTIFQFFSELEGVPEDKLLFLLNDKPIQPDDTPDSLQLSVVDFIDGGITTIDTTSEVNRNERKLKDGEIELKILCKDRKKPLTVTIHKEEKMLTLKMKVAEILELPQEKLKFIFDGEALSSNDTAADLDLEGGECIDLNVIE